MIKQSPVTIIQVKKSNIDRTPECHLLPFLPVIPLPQVTLTFGYLFSFIKSFTTSIGTPQKFLNFIWTKSIFIFFAFLLSLNIVSVNYSICSCWDCDLFIFIAICSPLYSCATIYLSRQLILKIFNWRVIALQCCVGFCHISTWISHWYTYVLCLLNLLPTYILSHWSWLLQKTGLSSLHQIANSHWWFYIW